MKTKVNLILIIILMIASCKEAPYEPELYGGLEGIVLDSETNTALESVSITTNPPTSAVQTEANGHFKIENIPTGTYTLTAKKHGYSKENIGISVTENKITNADIFMSLSDSENTPPEKPVVIAPADASKDLPISIDFIWSAHDVDENDSLNYDVYLFESNSTIKNKIAEGLTDTLLSVGDLKYSTNYYWYVVANDGQLESTVGDVWSFSTEALPDNPIIYSRYSVKTSFLI